MTRYLFYTLLAMLLITTTACKKSEPEEPIHVEESDLKDEKETIKSSINTPLSKRQMEYQEQALETLNSENAVEVLTELEQEIQREVDELQVQFDEIELELPED
ncbi:hypothetical protein DV096_05615 [Bradymonadaceae bacterium TMQ3]|uniref:Uncharacterized protein n=1 Tax=Lujinxingia sediminis TaxID=2480984 RepID=A0ABY0CW49_9DELT|nr:hypothetical protein [Lujinxingia sediminis]RDV40035.1 hypothetical protein DV096_05615 [Bradymonadaceae bacterium TMQ3]RVU47919.1 hypothetical protein EA187_00335 [Lujinxingia sediminis]TXC77220.1 hypothetical protein FRC91_00330 [Bradymonadales bacterium TMQ1]